MVEIVYISLSVCFFTAVVLWCLKQIVLAKKDASFFSRVDVDNLISTLSVSALTCMWFSISLSFTLYNKWILQEWQTGFSFPIIISSVHMIIKYIITRLWSCTPAAPVIESSSWTDYGLIVIPVGIFTVADIVLSNQSIILLPLSMYTTIKTATVIFTFMWAVLLDMEKFQWRLFLCVVAITAGISMAVFSSGKLNDVGVSLALGASIIGALRWVLLQVLSKRDAQCKKSMVTLYKFSPICAVAALPFALVMEVPQVERTEFYHSPMLLEEALGLCVLGGYISFLLLVVELQLLQETSSLTLGVIGQVKEIMQISIGMILFKDNLSLLSGGGIAISIAATYYYRVLKLDSVREGQIAELGYTTAVMNENVKYETLLMSSTHGIAAIKDSTASGANRSNTTNNTTTTNNNNNNSNNNNDNNNSSESASGSSDIVKATAHGADRGRFRNVSIKGSARNGDWKASTGTSSSLSSPIPPPPRTVTSNVTVTNTGNTIVGSSSNSCNATAPIEVEMTPTIGTPMPSSSSSSYIPPELSARK